MNRKEHDILKIIIMLVGCFAVGFLGTVAIADSPDSSRKELQIVAASRQVEPVRESPVPVTVITSQMIENIGAKTLKDVLITYVPGMTFVQDHNEMNVAMRGVYASSQQKILILLNGHRLNSRAYSAGNVDYSISLDKIKQIEILRGPGSVLYGNVALTAVINIVTKSGAALNGARVSAAAGDYGQRQGSLLYGKEFDDESDILIWAQHYQADGQEINISAEDDFSDFTTEDGYAIVGGMKDMPAYDVGMQYNSGPVSILASMRQSKYIEPFTAGGRISEIYDYRDYRTLMGAGPGLGSRFTHLGIEYQNSIAKDLDFLFRAYYDNAAIEVNLVMDPTIQKFGSAQWREYDYGFVSHLTKYYDLDRLGAGNILMGIQIDRMELYDSAFPFGTGGEYTGFLDNSGSLLLDTGEEVIYSAFVQAKHRLTDNVILNGGLRYDDKDRKEGGNVNALCPRLAVVYLPDENWDLKVSYSESFVDAPYWYRYNSVASYSGSSSLEPEYLKSFQVTPSWRRADGQFVGTVNFFYNSLEDFIFRVEDPMAVQKYENAGLLESWGVESEVAFIQRYYQIRANATHQEAIDADDYGADPPDVYNVPSLTANLILDVKPTQKFLLNLTCRYIGSQISPPKILGDESNYDLDDTVDGIFLLNTGFRLDRVLFDRVSIDARVYNVFDTEYYQGGSTRFAYPQEGRWCMVKLICDI